MILRTLLAFFLLASPALAQCPLTGPQTVNPPNVVSGVDSNCNLTQRQVQYTDLAFPALFGLNTTASNQVTVGLGDQVFYLDYDPGFQQGYTVQIISTIDPQAWMAGRISVYTNSGGQTQITVSVTQDQGDSFTGSGWYLQIVSSDAAFIPVTGVSLSSLTFGTSAGQISQGGVVSLGTESGLLLNNSHVVVVAIGSPTNYFRGISQYNSSTGALTIYTTDSSGSGTFTAWSLFAQDGPPVNANQIAVSQSAVTIGAGVQAFGIQAGQNLPIQGPVTITALSATANQILGTIYAYSSTVLSVLVPSSGIYGSGNYSAWSIVNTGPPQTRIPLYSQTGLAMYQDGTTATQVDIPPGSMRDSSDTVDLVLSSLTVINLASLTSIITVPQAGTITSVGVTVSGSSTAFSSNFAGSGSGLLTDFNNQCAAMNLSCFGNAGPGSIIGTSGQSSLVTSVVSNVNLVAAINLSVSTASFTRGGTVNTNNGTTFGKGLWYGIVLAMNNTTGITSAFATSFTLSGNPDLPAGYTYYRVAAVVYIQYTGTGYLMFIYQPLIGLPSAGLGNEYNVLTLSNIGGFNFSAWGQVNLSQTAAVVGQLPNANILNPQTTVAGQTCTLGSTCGLSLAFSKLTADVTLNASTYTDGPTMVQGNAGVWSVTAPITINDTSADAVNCKLWDGTTITSSQSSGITTGSKPISMTLAGILSNMTGNIRVSCISNNATTTKIKANQSGNGADSSIWGQRIQ